MSTGPANSWLEAISWRCTGSQQYVSNEKLSSYITSTNTDIKRQPYVHEEILASGSYNRNMSSRISDALWSKKNWKLVSNSGRVSKCDKITNTEYFVRRVARSTEILSWNR